MLVGMADSRVSEIRAAQTPRLEICAETLAAAHAASQGGADRIELCAELSGGGVTPSLGLVEQVLTRVTVPVHCMIRPRAGDFRYSDGELHAMRRDIELVRHAGAAGVVLGVLTEQATVDVDATRRLIEAARPMRVTFHRAFDITGDLDRALDAVIETGADILLTSGGRERVTDALDTVARLVERAQGRVEVMAGSGVRLDNARRVLEATRVDALHTSLRRGAPTHDRPALPGLAPAGTVQADEVRLLASLLRSQALPGAEGTADTPLRPTGV